MNNWLHAPDFNQQRATPVFSAFRHAISFKAWVLDEQNQPVAKLVQIAIPYSPTNHSAALKGSIFEPILG